MGRWSSKSWCPGPIVLCVSCVPVAVVCAVWLLRVECGSRSRLSLVPDPLAVGSLTFGVCSLWSVFLAESALALVRLMLDGLDVVYACCCCCNEIVSAV